VLGAVRIMRPLDRIAKIVVHNGLTAFCASPLWDLQYKILAANLERLVSHFMKK
jgi:hypothetical protein